jgi:hypothetical protein
MPKKRRPRLSQALTLGDVDQFLQKAYRFIGEKKYAHARQALHRSRNLLNQIRALPAAEAAGSPDGHASDH